MKYTKRLNRYDLFVLASLAGGTYRRKEDIIEFCQINKPKLINLSIGKLLHRGYIAMSSELGWIVPDNCYELTVEGLNELRNNILRR